MYVYTHIHIYVHIYILPHIYVHLSISRGSGIETGELAYQMWALMHTHTHTHTNVHIFIFISDHTRRLKNLDRRCDIQIAGTAIKPTWLSHGVV